jgi:DNA-binding transcriptional ArsR family regulator
MSTPDQDFVNLLHAISDPTRRKILQSLKVKGACSLDKQTGLCARDLEDRVHVSQPTISHHMGVLQKAGLIQAQKIGQWRWYRRNEPVIRAFAKSLKATL